MPKKKKTHIGWVVDFLAWFAYIGAELVPKKKFTLGWFTGLPPIVTIYILCVSCTSSTRNLLSKNLKKHTR